MAIPLIKLTRNRTSCVWTSEYEESFQQFKNKLTSTSILVVPNPEKDFVVYSDALRKGLGCVLMQKRKVVA